jgi:DNA (cytosine-5)-methyltransferase 1
MGVPQKRERVFFIAKRKDLAKPFLYQKDMFTVAPKLHLEFKEKEIKFKEIYEFGAEKNTINEHYQNLMNNLKKGEPDLRYPTKRLEGKENNFGNKIQYLDKVCYSILASDKDIVFKDNRFKTTSEFIKAGSFPSDYKFTGTRPSYLIGMSVPPIMIAQISLQIYEQWLSKAQ